MPARDGEGKPLVGKDGKPILRAKYTGLHALRHFYASGASTAAKMAGSDCRRKSCRNGSGIRPST